MNHACRTEVGSWTLSGGLFAGIVAGHHMMEWTPPAPTALAWIAAAVALVLLVALRNRPTWAVAIGIAAAAAGAAFGTAERQNNLRMDALLNESDQPAIRLHALAIESWTKDRWGHRSRVRIDGASRHGVDIALPARSRIEVRGVSEPTGLPDPGVPFDVLAELKGPAESPLLVVASPRLIVVTGPAEGPAAFRHHLVRRLRQAAGTDVDLHRAAATAAALALGRRDEIPDHRQEGWRRSGLAHAFAVSGLHVGVVSGLLWLVGVAAGMLPNRIRMTLLVLVPGYAILAGAAPSAVRAAGMVTLYMLARLLGRTVDPLAALGLAAGGLMILDPSLASGPGFQLTVVVTAALVRWAVPVADALRGPAWVRHAIAAPLVAALASSPIVALHFGRIVPLGLMANLAAPVLLSALVPLAVGAAATAWISPFLASGLLAIIGWIEGMLWWIGGLGRLWNPSVASVPGMVVGLFMVTGWVAILRWRGARWSAAAWTALWLSVPTVQVVTAGPGPERVELLRIGDGSAVLVSSGETTVLLDGGRSPHQAHRLLLESGVRRLAAVVVSHGDVDHLGGLPMVLRRHQVDALVMPSWMTSDPTAVSLIRAARRTDTPVRTMARGSRVLLGSIPASCLWPPAVAAPSAENDRSLVVRLILPSGSVLASGDIEGAAELRLARHTDIASDVLVAPHHGSRSSSTSAFLNGVDPDVVLIPAGPWNRYRHPHPATLERLRVLGLAFCAPVTDPLCRAVPGDNGWVLQRMAERP